MQLEEKTEAGLYVVGTPIGNRSELSPRARYILLQADAIACEDTRHTRRLFPEGASLPELIPYHEHNESALAPQLADRIGRGACIALVTDAGMPGICDPGFRLVRLCRTRGLPVRAVSGPSALINALAVSGLPTDSFLFLGFLAPKRSARQRAFAQHQDATYTLVFYESTHRILKALDDIASVLGPDRVICVARELTKVHETIFTGPVAAVAAAVKERSQKGEFVVLIAKTGYEL